MKRIPLDSKLMELLNELMSKDNCLYGITHSGKLYYLERKNPEESEPDVFNFIDDC